MFEAQEIEERYRTCRTFPSLKVFVNLSAHTEPDIVFCHFVELHQGGHLFVVENVLHKILVRISLYSLILIE